MSFIEIYFNWNYPLTNQETTLYIPQKVIRSIVLCRNKQLVLYIYYQLNIINQSSNIKGYVFFINEYNDKLI